jgi:hypothetical protein
MKRCMATIAIADFLNELTNREKEGIQSRYIQTIDTTLCNLTHLIPYSESLSMIKPGRVFRAIGLRITGTSSSSSSSSSPPSPIVAS